jgi:hypothetical protein
MGVTSRQRMEECAMPVWKDLATAFFAPLPVFDSIPHSTFEVYSQSPLFTRFPPLKFALFRVLRMRSKLKLTRLP